MRRLLLTIVVMVVGLVGAPGAARAQAPLPAGEALSANVQSLVNNDWLSGPYLGVMGAAGWRGARGDAFWFDAEPVAGAYDWSTFDRIKVAMDAASVRWQPILHGSPAWARDGGGRLDPPAERAYPDYARFAAAFVARYGPGGPMAGAWPVTDVEIGNEMNVLWARGAESYAALYAAAREAIRAVAGTGVRVVVGAVLYDSVPPTDADWIRAFFAALGGSGADAIGLHPYAPTAIGVVANLRRMHDGLVAAGQGALPVYVNELGWPAALDGAVPRARAVEGAVSDEARAGTTALLTDALLASDCSVRNIAYFDLVNQELRRADSDYLASETWKGLLRRGDGRLTVTGTAFQEAGARWRWTFGRLAGSVHVCGDGPARPLTGLALRITRPTPGCFRPYVTYRGFPIEEATVVVRAPDGRAARLLTQADGGLAQDFCVEPGVTFTLQADLAYPPAGVPAFAESVAYRCTPGTAAACAVVAGSGPGGAATGSGSGSGGGSGAGGGASGSGGGAVRPVSAAGRCLLRGAAVTGSRRVGVVLRRGLRVRFARCAGARGPRRVTLRATIDRRVARRLGLTKRLARKPVRVAAGSKTVRGARATGATLRFTRSARVRLRGARRVTLRVTVTVREGGGARASATRRATLRR